jgi:hypothetical protein
LATDASGVVRERLKQLADGYATWIQERRAEIDGLPEHLRKTAERNIEACERAVARMRAGIAVLESDEPARRAFALANRAMAAQMARSRWLREGKPEGGPDENAPAWRPFQVAFLLLCLPGIVESSSADRTIADLLWFPTGGGKTEAYLGLIAFTVFLRRLRSSRGGVTAIMRYTLRLLTLQQFERAAALLREDPRGRDISVLIVGEGPRRSTLSRLITDLGIANVHLHRGVPPEALDPFLAAADLGVSTERRGPSTTLRAKLFLYMGAGLPVLATDDGGEVRSTLYEAVDAQIQGYLLKPYQPKDLIEKDKSVMESAALRGGPGRRAGSRSTAPSSTTPRRNGGGRAVPRAASCGSARRLRSGSPSRPCRRWRSPRGA